APEVPHAEAGAAPPATAVRSEPRAVAPRPAAGVAAPAPETVGRARVYGRVRDAAHGTPVPGARVAVRLAGSEATQPLLTAVTDAEGGFAFDPAPTAALELVAAAEGWLVSPP